GAQGDFDGPAIATVFEIREDIRAHSLDVPESGVDGEESDRADVFARLLALDQFFVKCQGSVALPGHPVSHSELAQIDRGAAGDRHQALPGGERFGPTRQVT